MFALRADPRLLRDASARRSASARAAQAARRQAIPRDRAGDRRLAAHGARDLRGARRSSTRWSRSPWSRRRDDGEADAEALAGGVGPLGPGRAAAGPAHRLRVGRGADRLVHRRAPRAPRRADRRAHPGRHPRPASLPLPAQPDRPRALRRAAITPRRRRRTCALRHRRGGPHGAAPLDVTPPARRARCAVRRAVRGRCNTARMPSKGFETHWHKHPGVRSGDQLTRGERAADRMRNLMGSWPFVFSFFGVMAGWVILNTFVLAKLLDHKSFDPYPYILLNLFLSMLAGVQAAALLIAAKRADAISSEIALHTVHNTDDIKTLIAENTALTQEVKAGDRPARRDPPARGEHREGRRRRARAVPSGRDPAIRDLS